MSRDQARTVSECWASAIEFGAIELVPITIGAGEYSYWSYAGAFHVWVDRERIIRAEEQNVRV